jgi:hypothetical protein
MKEQIEMARKTKQKQSAGAVATARKPAGTRTGIIEDWRGTGANKFREKNDCGKTLRDGR